MCSMALDQQASIPVDVSQFHEFIGCLSVSGLAQYSSLIHFDLYKQLLRTVCILRISSSSRDLFGGKLDLSQDACKVPVGADAAIPWCCISYEIWFRAVLYAAVTPRANGTSAVAPSEIF